MHHPVVYYQLARIRQADLWQEADAQRLARLGRGAPNFRVRLAALVMALTALAGVARLFLG